ncbi:uncharacterized protein FIBRA_00949 [Fibroporia radiculosa]|uniref:Phosphoribulokinase/uridine kinase domain-containing protein n=1 Tax=Fibroporia radiculosa TaxID=599839 RepID=J4HSI6_9APHY|nr:uncharacterized protein FIBRA_00949 [Fibroporia radiculosa]CCL98942.1 predicted protein [Fibroporia radiculosa]
MEQQARELADILVNRINSTSATSRVLVGLAGVPASGKSTLAKLVIDQVNATFRNTPGLSAEGEPIPADSDADENIAVLIGLDGWHLTRAQLDAMPDPQRAHDRRGAHWTFDGEGFAKYVQALREPHLPSSAPSAHLKSSAIYAPSFDHALKDPSFNAIPVYPHHRLVLIEGLYPFLNFYPWKTAAELLDERWWLEVGDAEAERRLVARHVHTGVAKDLAEANWRSRENDVPNGRFIKEHMLEPTRVIQSVDDPKLTVL